jgi:hypothetical protein
VYRVSDPLFIKKGIRMTRFEVSRINRILQPLKNFFFSMTLLAAAFALGCNSSKETATSSSSTPSSSSASPSSPGGGGNFEGTVTAKMFGGDKDIQLNYSIKGALSRIETSATEERQSFTGVMILDMKSGKQLMLMPPAKTYMEMNLKEIGEQFKGGEDSTKVPKLTPTGKQETIAGYTCEHWLVGEDQKTDMCVAKGIGFFGFGSNEQSGGPLNALRNLNIDPQIAAQIEGNPELKKFVEGGAFPLKITQIEDGQPRTIMEVTGIERKTLDDSLFTIPPGYKKMEIPGMPSGAR